MSGTLLARPNLAGEAGLLRKDAEKEPTLSPKANEVDIEIAAGCDHPEAAVLLEHDFGQGPPPSPVFDDSKDVDRVDATLSQEYRHMGFSRRYRAFQALVMIVTALFLFGLPFWSWLFNDYLGNAKTLCHTPAEEIVCGNGADYMEIARRLGRVDDDGKLFGCSCENAIFADWACAANAGSFSVSYFISTAPGTGAMSAIAAWPILAQWLHGSGFYAGACNDLYQECPRLNSVLQVALQATQVSFQFFFGLFLFNTLCVMPKAHAVVVTLFILSLVVHFITLAIAMGARTKVGKIIQVFAVVGSVSVVTGFVWPVGPTWLGQHAFWLGECIGLTCAFGVVPMITLVI